MGAPEQIASGHEARPTGVRHVVVGALCIAAAINYIPRNFISVAEKTIRTDLGLTTFQSGWVLSAFFITYALAQIPSGQMGQAWGSRRVLSVIAVLWSLMSGAAALASGFFVLFLTRLGIGAAQAGIFPCSTNSIAKWVPPRRWALANGLLGSAMQFGNAAALMLTGFLLEGLSWGPIVLDGLGWRWIVVLYAVPGIVWAGWFYLWFRDRPEEHGGVNAAELKVIREGRQEPSNKSAPLPAEPTPWVSIFTSWAMICICTQQFLRAAGFMLFNSRFATFLQETRSVSVAEAGVLNSLPVWATVVGSAVCGYISDWLMARTGSRRISRQWFAAGGMLVFGILIVMANDISNVWLAVGVVSLGSFIASSGGPCAYTITIDMGGKHIAPVFSTMNMAGNIGAAVFPHLVPPLIAWTGNWNLVMLMFAGIFVAAAVCWIPFNPNGTIFDRPGSRAGAA